jgi:hypothetical protein
MSGSGASGFVGAAVDIGEPVSIREWMSTLKDDPSPDKESMNQVVMATVIGLVAGLAISALIVVSHDLLTVGRLLLPRVLFTSAVAALLATTAFGRGRTHFAKKALYDFPLLALDIVMIVAAWPCNSGAK